MATQSEKIDSILERNRRVESDKAWETSLMRRGVLALATYAVVLYFLIVIDAPNPFLNALVPPIAYLLQQWSMPFLRTYWQKHFYKK
ncbi:MAG: hypothetical protein NUV67_00185 [archaeon]|nr:hypothetical protein [archaeon]